ILGAATWLRRVLGVAGGHRQLLNIATDQMMLPTSDTPPTTMPATASPWPPSLLVLIWFSATMPSTMPMIEPSPKKQNGTKPMSDATRDAIASWFVFWPGCPYAE